jgi:hypothetical protein
MQERTYAHTYTHTHTHTRTRACTRTRTKAIKHSLLPPYPLHTAPLPCPPCTRPRIRTRTRRGGNRRHAQRTLRCRRVQMHGCKDEQKTRSAGCVLLSPLSDPLAASIPRRRSSRDCWLTVTPPKPLGCPPPADPLPRMPKHNARHTWSGEVCCAGAIREKKAGACERASASVPRHRASVYVRRACVRACILLDAHVCHAWQPMHAGQGQWMDGRMPVAARPLDTLARLETGQDTTRRLGGRRKACTMA